jgi:hypothetical protein
MCPDPKCFHPLNIVVSIPKIKFYSVHAFIDGQKIFQLVPIDTPPDLNHFILICKLILLSLDTLDDYLDHDFSVFDGFKIQNQSFVAVGITPLLFSFSSTALQEDQKKVL